MAWHINMAGWPGQNGICTYNYLFWPKNDSEKWSRIFFYIPPCGNFFSCFIKGKIFAPNYKCSNKTNFLPALRDFKIKISRLLFTIIFRAKRVICIQSLFWPGKRWLNSNHIIVKNKLIFRWNRLNSSNQTSEHMFVKNIEVNRLADQTIRSAARVTKKCPRILWWRLTEVGVSHFLAQSQKGWLGGANCLSRGQKKKGPLSTNMVLYWYGSR